jgi:hypothetical protein
MLGAFAFLLMVAFVPWISGAATASRWVLMSAVVPPAVMLSDLPRMTPAHLLGALLLAWGATTLLWTSSLPDGLNALWQLFLIAGCFIIGTTQASLRPVYVGAGLGLAVNSAFVLLQWWGLHPLPTTPGIVGMGALFINPNYLAGAAAIVLVALAGCRLWWPAALVLPCLLVPGARTAFAAVTVPALVWLWGRSRVAAVLGMALVLVAFPASHWLVYHFGSDGERLLIWQDTAQNLTWLGHGLGSFYTSFAGHTHIDLLSSRPAHAHSDALELAYETGWPGVILCLTLLVYILAAPRQVETYVLLALLTEAALDMPLHFPVPQFLGGLVAGGLCRDRIALRDVVGHGRVALCGGLAWWRATDAGAGGRDVPAEL